MYLFLVLRTSGAGGSRNSQYGMFGTEKIKDPRPLHDKAFIQQCIKQLCEVTHSLILQNCLLGNKSTTQNICFLIVSTIDFVDKHAI